MSHIVSRKQPMGRTQVEVQFPNQFSKDTLVIEFKRTSSITKAVFNLEELDEFLLILTYYRKELADEIEAHQKGKDLR